MSAKTSARHQGRIPSLPHYGLARAEARGAVIPFCSLVGGIEPVGVGIGLLVTWGLGLGAGRAVRRVRLERPSWLWGVDGKSAVKFLGWLEQTAFFAAIWLNHPLGIGAWLAFKVATKWNAWTMLGKVPDDLGGDTGTGRARSRAEWAAYVNNRLLIGTLYNVLCGVAGAAAGRWVIRLCACQS